jgi:hypothetical protein
MRNASNQQEQAITALLGLLSEDGPLAPSVLIQSAVEKFGISSDALLIGWHHLLTEGRLQFTHDGGVSIVVQRDDETESFHALSDLRSYVAGHSQPMHHHELIEKLRPTTQARRQALWQAIFAMTRTGELVAKNHDGRLVRDNG